MADCIIAGGTESMSLVPTAGWKTVPAYSIAVEEPDYYFFSVCDEKGKCSEKERSADLTKPEYKGMIVMSNPASSGTGFLSVSGVLQNKGEKEGWNYLDALNKNIAQYVHSGSKPCKIAGTGEYPIGISFDYRAVKQKNAGEPIEEHERQGPDETGVGRCRP
jgi:ABC-type thiamine transport system substrate-binding protein